MSQISTELIGVAQRKQILGLASRLPHADQVAFEARLAPDDRQVDLAFCVVNQTDEHRLFQAFVRQQAQGNKEIWERLSKLLTDPLYTGVSYLWLEYDMNAEPDSPPGLFLAVYPDQRPSLSTTRQILNCLFNLSSVPDALLQNLTRCFDHLPTNARLHTLGNFLGRPLQAVRVPPYNIAPDMLKSFLDAIGYSGDSQAVEDLVVRYAPYSDQLEIDLDVGEHVFPRIGLHLYLNKQPAMEPRWQALFDQLVSEGLCSLAKRDALLTLSGSTLLLHDKDAPDYLLIKHLLTAPDLQCWLLRGLSHVKLVYHPAQPLSTKVYFGYQIAWLPCS